MPHPYTKTPLLRASTLCISLAILTQLLLATVATARPHRTTSGSPFVIGERVKHRLNRQTECIFSRRIYEIGSRWFPDFGPPLGINYCLRCECIAETKLRRVIARSTCTNVRDQCPELHCDRPVHVEGRCCKVCPGQELPPNSPDLLMLSDAARGNDADSMETSYYAALLTGRTSMFLRRDAIKSLYTTANPQNIVATGRFKYMQKNLYYSFYVSALAPRPRIVQFIDAAGRILQEHSLVLSATGPLSVYQNQTDKTCGVWRRLSADMRHMLRNKQISVVLMWGGPHQAELALAGRLTNYTALPMEQYSSLLEADAGTKREQMRGGGGTAVVLSHYDPTAESHVNVTLVFNGLFGPRDLANVTLNGRFEMDNGTVVGENQTFVIEKPALDYNRVVFSSLMSTQAMRMMSNGRIAIVIESARNRNLRLRGNITTRCACELFQNVLHPLRSDRKQRSSGLAWMYVNRRGDLIYHAVTDVLGTRRNGRPQLSLWDSSIKHRIRIEGKTLPGNRTNILASGCLTRVGPRFHAALYAGHINVQLLKPQQKETPLVTGRMLHEEMADSRDSTQPVLLRRLNLSRPAEQVGMAWLSVDMECSLRYEVTMNMVVNRTYHLVMVDVPVEAAGAPQRRRVLDKWNGPRFYGFQMGMQPADLKRFQTHIVHFLVQWRKKTIVRGRMHKITIPEHCLAAAGDLQNAGPFGGMENGPLAGGSEVAASKPAKQTCYESRRFHRDGEQWRSADFSCTVCSCMHGKAMCEQMQCPPLLCTPEMQTRRRGECCATCMLIEGNGTTLDAGVNAAEGDEERGCWLGQQFHTAGSTFHPYLPPNSFDTCAICTCDARTLEVTCPRVQCPSLQCAEKLAYKPDRSVCCRVCPQNVTANATIVAPAETAAFTTITNVNINDVMHDGSSADTELARDDPFGDELHPHVYHASQEDSDSGTNSSHKITDGSCRIGEKLFANGQIWHPTFETGPKVCIVCRCNDSQPSCQTSTYCARSVCARLDEQWSAATPEARDVMLRNRSRTGAVSEDGGVRECCENVCKRTGGYNEQPIDVLKALEEYITAQKRGE